MSTIAEILDRFERDYLPTLAPRTQGEYRRYIANCKAEWGDRNPDEMSPRDFADFLNVARGKTWRAKHLACLSSALSLGMGRWYMCEKNVIRNMRLFKNPPRDRLILDPEFEACKAIAPKRVQCAMMLALLTGQRQGDIIRFKWSDIRTVTVTEPDGGTRTIEELHIYQTKTGKRLAIEINPELEVVLDQCWRLKGSGSTGGEYILPTRTGKPYTSEGFRACWQRVMRRYKRTAEDFHFHDIRGMAATKCATVEEARALLGHTSMNMTYRVYRRGVERVKALRLHVPDRSGHSAVDRL